MSLFDEGFAADVEHIQEYERVLVSRGLQDLWTIVLEAIF